MKTKIKICGVVQAEHVLTAAKAGADALGLNFVPSSKRYIGGAKEAAALMAECAAVHITWAGVFVDPQFEALIAMQSELKLGIIQLHGDESPEFAQRVKAATGAEVWKAFRVATKADLSQIPTYQCDGWVLDAKVAGQHGGSGLTFDWNILSDLPRSTPLILSGGLNPRNVGEAVRLVRPNWVDVASGVESAPGVKDSALIDAFARAARSA